MLFVVPGLRSLVTDDGAVILDVERNLSVSVNATGAYIWNRLTLGQSVDDIAGGLQSATGASPTQVQEDVAFFITELKKTGLITETQLQR